MMARLRQLITEAGLNALLPEWQRLFVRLNEPTFSVAVAGEFSRGKSTLINRLLGADLLPVGDLPTTALLTHVRHGQTPACGTCTPAGSGTGWSWRPSPGKG
jgi:ribosome biogenesis GTPase A